MKPENMMMVYSWDTAGQIECIKLFCDLVGGHHNIGGGFIDCGNDGVCITQKRSLASWDHNWLSMLVFMGHDRCIRVEIQAGGPGKLRVILHKRKGREGRMMDRHPTLETAISEYRASTIGGIQL